MAGMSVQGPRDWCPQILVFAEDPPRRAQLLWFASWAEGGSGLTMAVRVLEGDGIALRRQKEDAINQLKRESATLKVEAYPLVVVAPKLREATRFILQAFGVGSLHTNTALFNKGNVQTHTS